MVSEYGIKSINSYDIFANVIPGLIFLFGLLIPFHPEPLLKAIFGENWGLSLGIPQLLLLAVVSFVCGQLIQTIGGRVDGDHGFTNLIRKSRGGDVDCRYDISEFEISLWRACRDKFKISRNFDSHTRLFKAILAHLEDSGKRRALRMQALYLFTRGLVVSMKLLAGIYVILAISIEEGYFPTEWDPLFRETWVMLAGAIILFFGWIQVNKARRELEEDWIEYTVTEFYLDMVENQGKKYSS